MSMEWVQSFSSCADNRPPLVDIRSPVAYSERHVDGATHFDGLHGPDGLLSRLNELPAPPVRLTLALLASTAAEAEEAVAGLQARGHSSPIVLTEAMLHALPFESGSNSRALWRPAPVLAAELPRVLTGIGTELTALDIGSGSGRDSAFLAAEGFKVTAVDRDPVLLAKAARFGNREARIGGRVRTELRTLGAHLSEDRDWLRKRKAGLLLVVRFLRRGVLELLHEGVRDGGFVVYEHFLRGCEKFGGPKKDSQMLEPGELRRVFSEGRGFKVLRDDEEKLSDGRPVVRFVAHRVLGS